MEIQDRVLDKLDKIDDRLNKQEITLTQIQADVAYHIHRTDLAEENTANIKIETDARLIKLEKWSDKFHYLGWLLLGILGVLDKMSAIKTFFRF